MVLLVKKLSMSDQGVPLPEARAATVRRRSRGMTMRTREALQGYLFASPWLLGLCVLTVGPMIYSFYISFTHYDVLSPPVWLGLANYHDLFLADPMFWTALGNTVYYTIFSVPLGLLGSLLLALLLNRQVRGIALFRAAYYIPTVISTVPVAILWTWLLDPNAGLINQALSLVGIHGPTWLASPEWSKPSLVLMSLWGIGGATMVIYLAGLQGIPQHLYEAAEIDGASTWTRFRQITVPMLSPTTFFNLIMGIIGSFQVFTQAWVMTQGGPLDSTTFYSLYLYKEGFQYLYMGYASAMAWVLLVITLALTLFNFALARRWVYYEGGLTG
jgi:multiple sugar transport system permease protein